MTNVRGGGKKRAGKNAGSHAHLMLDRRRQVAALYLKGLTQAEIAGKFGVTQNTISNDLKAIRDEWLAEALVDFDAKKAEELAKIDNLEAVCWEQFGKSCEDAEFRVRRVEEELRSHKGPDAEGEGDAGNGTPPVRGPGKGKAAKSFVTKMTPVRKSEEVRTKGQSGDPRFLERISWCIDTRLKIMGAYAKDKVPAVDRLVVQWDELYERAAKRPDPVEEAIRLAGREGRILEAPAADTRITTAPPDQASADEPSDVSQERAAGEAEAFGAPYPSPHPEEQEDGGDDEHNLSGV